MKVYNFRPTLDLSYSLTQVISAINPRQRYEGLDFVETDVLVSHRNLFKTSINKKQMINKITKSDLFILDLSIEISNRKLMESNSSFQSLQDFVSLIGKNRILLVANSYSENNHKSVLLRGAIDDLAQKLGVEFFDVADCLEVWSPSQLFINENFPSSLSSDGRKVVGSRIQSIVQKHFIPLTSRYVNPQIPLVQVLDNSGTEIMTETFGFGDMIFGACFVHQIAQILGRPAAIDWNLFSSKIYLNRPSDFPAMNNLNLAKTTTKVNHFSKRVKFEDLEKISTNLRPSLPLSISTRDFLFTNGLWPSEELLFYLEEELRRLNFVKGQYQVVQIRLGDAYSFENRFDSNLLTADVKKIENNLKNHISQSENVLIISDSSAALEILRKSGWKTRNTEPVHLGISNNIELEKETLIDFFLLGFSNSILQYSNYYWGSGFSYVASQLFDIDLKAVSISRLK